MVRRIPSGRTLREVLLRDPSTLANLAHRAGISRSYLLHLAAGTRNPSSGTVEGLASALDVSEGWVRRACLAASA